MPKYQYYANAVVKQEGSKFVTMYITDVVKAGNMADAVTLSHEEAGNELLSGSTITSFNVHTYEEGPGPLSAGY